MTWAKLEPVAGDIGGGACCTDRPNKAPMDMVIAIGFGCAMVTKDGALVWEERPDTHWDKLWRVRKAERRARLDPDHDWRISIYGPMYSAVWQRHGRSEWVMVEKGEGFA